MSANLGSHEEGSACQPIKAGARFTILRVQRYTISMIPPKKLSKIIPPCTGDHRYLESHGYFIRTRKPQNERKLSFFSCFPCSEKAQTDKLMQN